MAFGEERVGTGSDAETHRTSETYENLQNGSICLCTLKNQRKHRVVGDISSSVITKIRKNSSSHSNLSQWPGIHGSHNTSVAFFGA